MHPTRRQLVQALMTALICALALPTSAQILKVPGCRGKVVKPGKRKACVQCVQRKRPHAYYRSARVGNRCRPVAVGTAAKPLGGAAAIKTVAGCSRRLRKPAKKAACVSCLRRPRPHVFYGAARAGKRCRLLVVTPGAARKIQKVRRNAPPNAIVAVVGCNNRVRKPNKRRACIACVKRPRKHWFFKGRRPGKRCVLAR